jgi:hypothetical protein
VWPHAFPSPRHRTAIRLRQYDPRVIQVKLDCHLSMTPTRCCMRSSKWAVLADSTGSDSIPYGAYATYAKRFCHENPSFAYRVCEIRHEETNVSFPLPRKKGSSISDGDILARYPFDFFLSSLTTSTPESSSNEACELAVPWPHSLSLFFVCMWTWRSGKAPPRLQRRTKTRRTRGQDNCALTPSQNSYLSARAFIARHVGFKLL